MCPQLCNSVVELNCNGRNIICLVHSVVMESVIEVMHPCFGNSKIDSISWRLISLRFCLILRLFSVKAHKESCRAVRFVDSGKGNALLPFLIECSYIPANL